MKDVVNFIKKARYLIKSGSCRFERRNDYGKDYIEVLIEDFNISLEEAWEQIKNLNHNMIYFDNKPDYYDGSNAYVFKKEINKVMGYIKLNIEIGINGEELVVISFHKDKRRSRYGN